MKQALAFSDNPPAAIRALLREDDKAAELAARDGNSLVYAANRVPEIADDIVNIDRAMRWGFNWDLGIFEGWDAIGVGDSVAGMKAGGWDVPAWVVDMLEKGRESFYKVENGVQTYWDPTTGAARPVPNSDGWLWVGDVKASNGVVSKNDSAELIDLGDGALLLQFTKPQQMNAIEEEMMVYNRPWTAARRVSSPPSSSAPSSIRGHLPPQRGPQRPGLLRRRQPMMMGMAAMQGQWDDIDRQIKGLQDTSSGRATAASPW